MRFSFLSIISITLLFSCTKEIIQHKLSVSVTPINGGSVSPPSNSYEKGQSLQMLATPTGEYVFKEWKGDLSGSINPSTLIIDKDKTITGSFEKRQYPLTLTIDGSGTIKEEIIGVATQALYPSGTTVRLTPQPLEGWAFSGWSGDLTSAANPLDLKIEKAINLKATFSKLNITSIKIENPIDTLVISQKHKYIVKGTYSNNTTIDLSSLIKTSSLESKVNFISGGNIIGKVSGSAKIKISYENLSLEDDIYVSPIEYVKVDQKLKSNGKGKITVPVVLINYLPTKDGVLLDMERAPDGYSNILNSTLDRAKVKIFEDKIVEKNVIEEGTRFRDYATNKIDPYISINVIAYINVYEVDYAPNPDGGAIQIVNWTNLFSKLNMKDFVEKSGVKEVWFTAFPKEGYPSVLKQPNPTDKSLWFNMPESNMSSPTGDVSNSYRNNKDLPIYSKTYVVYGFNAHRGADTDLHNRGHQIEAQLSYFDSDLIWKKAFLPTSTLKEFRLGNCHWPPNAKSDYDYANKTSVKSDIATWQPSGGLYVDVNVDTWLNKNYIFNMNATNLNGGLTNYANDAQVKWFIYWWQSIPGLDNKIQYNGKQLTNWWDLFYNWDDAIKNKKTLWVQ
jgi:hypothetical protein